MFPELFQGESGIRPMRSALLFGPPGTGKTLLAHALGAISSRPKGALRHHEHYWSPTDWIGSDWVAAELNGKMTQVRAGDIMSAFFGQTERYPSTHRATIDSYCSTQALDTLAKAHPRIGRCRNLSKLFAAVRNHRRRTGDLVIVFIDELDSFCRARTAAEDESTRRLKNQLLLELDETTSTDQEGLFVLAGYALSIEALSIAAQG